MLAKNELRNYPTGTTAILLWRDKRQKEKPKVLITFPVREEERLIRHGPMHASDLA